MTARSTIIRCSRCRARILWVRMEVTGKSIPVDPDPTDAGNVCAVGNVRGLRGRVVPPGVPVPEHETRYMPHFATCPKYSRTEGGETHPPAGVEPAQAALFDELEGS